VTRASRVSGIGKKALGGHKRGSITEKGSQKGTNNQRIIILTNKRRVSRITWEKPRKRIVYRLLLDLAISEKRKEERRGPIQLKKISRLLPIRRGIKQTTA